MLQDQHAPIQCDCLGQMLRNTSTAVHVVLDGLQRWHHWIAGRAAAGGTRAIRAAAAEQPAGMPLSAAISCDLAPFLAADNAETSSSAPGFSEQEDNVGFSLMQKILHVVTGRLGLHPRRAPCSTLV